MSIYFVYFVMGNNTSYFFHRVVDSFPLILKLINIRLKQVLVAKRGKMAVLTKLVGILRFLLLLVENCM